MNSEEKKFSLYLTVLRFLVFKITSNLNKIFLDVNMNKHKILLTAYYKHNPSVLELELLDDIVTNSKAHIPDYIVEARYKLIEDFEVDEKHDFIVFAVYDDSDS